MTEAPCPFNRYQLTTFSAISATIFQISSAVFVQIGANDHTR